MQVRDLGVAPGICTNICHLQPGSRDTASHLPGSYGGQRFQGEVANHSAGFLHSGVREVQGSCESFKKVSVVILCNSLVRYCLWGRLGKGCMGSVCIISYNCMGIHNSLQNLSLIRKEKKKKTVPIVSLTYRGSFACGFPVPAFGVEIHRNADYPNSPCRGKGHDLLEKSAWGCPAPTAPCIINNDLHLLEINVFLLSTEFGLLLSNPIPACCSQIFMSKMSVK